MNLFIDIDGVLLGRSPITSKPALANDAHKFLNFCLDNYRCFWLTTHCKGSADTALDYLSPYADEAFLTLAQKIQPTYFKTFKTEALFGDYYWIDDQPSAYEFQFLEETDALHRWLQINTRKNFDGLNEILKFLKKNHPTAKLLLPEHPH